MSAKRLRGAATLLLLLVLAVAGAARASPWLDSRPITVGHRGTTIIEDENTMASYQAAVDHGLDVIECDPKLTADGVYVIMHDDTVDRTTDGSGAISSMTLEEVRELRTASGHQVPTLEEVLVLARDYDMSVYLDMKSPPPDGAALLVGLIEDLGMTDRVIVGCWRKKTCRMVEARDPKISTCVSWPWPALTMGQAERMGADAIGTLRGLASKWAVRRAHQRGLRVITMPINDPDELIEFKARGLDALQSDDPRLLEPHGKNGSKKPESDSGPLPH